MDEIKNKTEARQLIEQTKKMMEEYSLNKLKKQNGFKNILNSKNSKIDVHNQKQNTNMNPQQYPGQPPAYSGYPYQQRPKRGVNTVLVAIICVLVTLLLAGVVWFFFGRGDSNHAAQPVDRHRDTVIVREKETVIERQVPGETTTSTTRVVPSNPTQLKVTGTNVCLRLSPNIPSGPDKYSNCLKYTNGTNVHPSKGQVLPYHGQSGDFYQTQFGGYIVYISKDYSMPM